MISPKVYYIEYCNRKFIAIKDSDNEYINKICQLVNKVSKIKIDEDELKLEMIYKDKVVIFNLDETIFIPSVIFNTLKYDVDISLRNKIKESILEGGDVEWIVKLFTT